MLTGFKVSLAIKCVLFIPEHKANGEPLKWSFEVLGMQRWDKSTDKSIEFKSRCKNGAKML